MSCEQTAMSKNKNIQKLKLIADGSMLKAISTK
jgi:hypothetical protein